MVRRLSLGMTLSLVIGLLAAPALARAASHTFIATPQFEPAAMTEGPARPYPGTIAVSGLEGTVTSVSVTMLDLNAGNQLDMALVGPNGQAVMLLSDACSTNKSNEAFWKFEDAAPIFAPVGACNQGFPTLFDPQSRLRPTDFGPLSDDAFPGGPAGPFGNKLAALAGGSPNGDWNLFLFDDVLGELGFLLGGWALHLEVAPPPAPPPPAPTVITVQVPATGKRAAALAKCKQKKKPAKRRACRANAAKLPV